MGINRLIQIIDYLIILKILNNQLFFNRLNRINRLIAHHYFFVDHPVQRNHCDTFLFDCELHCTAATNILPVNT